MGSRHCVFSISTGAGKVAMIKHALSYLPASHIRAKGINCPRYIKTQDKWILPVRVPICGQLIVHRIQTNGMHTDADLAHIRLRPVYFPWMQCVWFSRFI